MKRFLSLSAAAIFLIASSAPMLAENGVSSSTPGHKLHSTSPDNRGTIHGASKMSPGYKMRHTSPTTNPHNRGMAKGASQYAPGNPR